MVRKHSEVDALVNIISGYMSQGGLAVTVKDSKNENVMITGSVANDTRFGDEEDITYSLIRPRGKFLGVVVGPHKDTIQGNLMPWIVRNVDYALEQLRYGTVKNFAGLAIYMRQKI